MTNSAIICFTLRHVYFEDFGNAAVVSYFFMLVAGVLLLKAALGFVVPNVPNWVSMQLKRQDFIVSKLLDMQPDDGASPRYLAF